MQGSRDHALALVLFFPSTEPGGFEEAATEALLGSGSFHIYREWKFVSTINLLRHSKAQSAYKSQNYEHFVELLSFPLYIQI